MKRYVACALLFLVPLTQAQTPKRLIVKCATVAPDGSLWMKILEQMNKEVFRKTRGRVRFKFFAGGIAGEERAVLEKMRYGQLQAAALTGVGMGEVVPSARIMELPFLFRDTDEYDYVLGKIAPRFEKMFEAKGFVVLGWAEGGFAHVFSQLKITTLEQLKSARCWVRQGDQLTERVVQEIGTHGVSLAMSEVLTSVQTGLVDTVYVSPLALIALQWFPHFKYMVDIPLVNIETGVVMSKKTFDSMSKADGKSVRSICHKYTRRLVQAVRVDDLKSKKILLEKGIKILVPAVSEVAKFNEISRRSAAGLVGKLYSAELLKEVQQLLAAFRAQKK